MWYVYILKCRDGRYYTGCTNDIVDRLKRHSRGQIHFTMSRLPVHIISYTAFKDKYKAFNYERYLKSGSGMAFRNKRLI